MKKGSKLEKVLSAIVLTLYFPVYVTGWVLVWVARLILAISYSFMLDFCKSKDILTNIFRYHGRD